MAVFRAQVFYTSSRGDKWTNVYHISADDLGGARSSMSSIGVPALRQFLHPACTLVKILYSSLTDDTFITDNIESAGLSADSGSLLPIFNSAKIFFSTTAVGRPDYKFLRGYLTETLITGDEIEPTAVSGIDAGFSDLVTDMAGDDSPLCSESGDLWGIVSVQSKVQMRQPHRRRKRTPAP